MLRNWWALLAPLTSLTLLISGCPDAESSGCEPAEARACRGEDNCSGEQVCNASGFGWGACMCSSPGVAEPVNPGTNPPPLGCTPGATRSCTGSNVDGSCVGVASCDSSGTYGPCICPPVPGNPTGTRPNVLGVSCTRNADCGTSLRCWEEAAGLGGVLGAPAGGYCTTFCLSVSDCAVFDATAACVRFSSSNTGFCVAGCLAQPPTADPALCADRPDAGVVSSDAG
jgi:hypothetical protein